MLGRKHIKKVIAAGLCVVMMSMGIGANAATSVNSFNLSTSAASGSASTPEVIKDNTDDSAYVNINSYTFNGTSGTLMMRVKKGTSYVTDSYAVTKTGPYSLEYKNGTITPGSKYSLQIYTSSSSAYGTNVIGVWRP